MRHTAIPFSQRAEFEAICDAEDRAFADAETKGSALQNAVKLWLGSGRTAATSDNDIEALFDTLRRLGAQL